MAAQQGWLHCWLRRLAAQEPFRSMLAQLAAPRAAPLAA